MDETQQIWKTAEEILNDQNIKDDQKKDLIRTISLNKKLNEKEIEIHNAYQAVSIEKNEYIQKYHDIEDIINYMMYFYIKFLFYL